MHMLDMQIPYCVLCLRIAKYVVSKHEIGDHFYCVNCSFRKERCDSLRQIDYLFKKVEGELSEENELNVEDEQSKEEFKELDKSLFHV